MAENEGEQMIKCIAIDDQYESIKCLEKYISDTPNMRLVTYYTDPVIALLEIRKLNKIDAIFLDIQMPQISGIELAKAIRSKTRKLIFTTSYREFALDAFEAEADAYLLKPYSYAKFALTITRLFEDELRGSEEDFFFVKNKEENNKAVMLKYENIISFESFHNYIKIHTVSKSIIAYLTLRDVHEQLNIKSGFIQLHRGYIIAIKHIKHIEGTKITLSDDSIITVGDIYQDDFRKFIKENIIISNRKK
ncbi:response regulator transcription factor [Agrobacterium tumefaciens]|nr:response regulator transcription factor [Agrobacterium tumefaciens]NTE22261.1 response regulator transcription factor [Agrobacterium tumefaciens]